MFNQLSRVVHLSHPEICPNDPSHPSSLRGGASLFVEAIQRGEAVTQWPRVLLVVAKQHRRWWETPLELIAPHNVIVQPHTKGTAAGLLLLILHIVSRDPLATILVLPSDHFVHDEAKLARTLERAVHFAGEDRLYVHFLGLSLRDVDPEFGYTEPAMPKGLSVAPLRRLVGGIAAVVEGDKGNTQEATAAWRLYRQLPTFDFSRDVLKGQVPWLRVLTVPDCGCSDLGTPGRIAETLAWIGARPARDTDGAACLNLAEQHARLGTDCRAVSGL